jgi:hypothetical protein
VNGQALLKAERASFLERLFEGYSITAAARAARIDRSTAFKIRARDPEFALQWDEAIEMGTDLLEDEAVRRGREGVPRAIYQGGVRVGIETVYSANPASKKI